MNGSPSGIESLTYSNPGCAYSMVKKTIQDKEYEYAGSQAKPSCAETYIDLARPSSEVNAALSAQQFPIPPGTYKYARFCISSVQMSVPAHVSTPTVFERPEESSGGCLFVETDNFTVKEGDVVSLKIDYDLSDGIVTVVAPGSSGAICKTSETPNLDVCTEGGAPFTIQVPK